MTDQLEEKLRIKNLSKQIIELTYMETTKERDWTEVTKWQVQKFTFQSLGSKQPNIAQAWSPEIELLAVDGKTPVCKLFLYKYWNRPVDLTAWENIIEQRLSQGELLTLIRHLNTDLVPGDKTKCLAHNRSCVQKVELYYEESARRVARL